VLYSPVLKLLDRYVIRELVPPALLGLLLCTFVLLMNQILLLAELFIHKGVPVGTAAEVLALLIPSILAFAVPMSVLMGILGGFSRLSTDSEITAWRTLGIGLPRLFRPALVFALGGWLAASALALFVAPRANARWVRAMTDSVLTRVELRTRALEFDESIPNTVLFIRNVLRGGMWEDVFVFFHRDRLEPRIAVARRGTIRLDPENKRATLVLHDGIVHSGRLSSPDEYRTTSFRRFEEDIDVESLFASVSSEKRVREKDIAELFRDAGAVREKIASFGASAETGQDEKRELSSLFRGLRSHLVEIHKKFALPFVALVFVFIGLPLGAVTGRGGRTSGFTLSLAVILLFYTLITAGEKLAVDGRISPSLGMWGPDLILGGIAVALWFVTRGGTRGVPRPVFAFRRVIARTVPQAGSRAHPPRRKFVRGAPRFPHILDRYISRKYLAIFGLVFAGLVAVSALAVFFERLDDVTRHGKPLGMLLHYLWFRMPEIIFFVLPVATLTASLLSLGLLAKFNEVTAMKAAGISLRRISAPVVVLALFAVGIAFLVQERLLPASNLRAEEIVNRINDLPPRSYSFPNRHWILGRNKDRIYHFEFFDAPSSAFRRLSLFDFDLESWSLRRWIYAETASLGEKELVIQGGWIREFPGGGEGLFVVPDGWKLVIPETGSYFFKERKAPSAMSIRELRSYTREVREMGFRAARLRVDLGTKIAFPLVSLVMALVALPFAFSLGKRGTLVGVGLAVVIAAVYWGGVAIFRSLGTNEFLPPVLAVWGPHLLFGLAGVFGFLRLRT
jgi:LPS export ABC transporter permease LptF/LPS export ABC transporter permease LptG